MERELINQKKGSRIIQQKGGYGGQAHIVDNRANPVQGLMMNRNVAQRVIQRTREADGRFEYVPNIKKYDDRIPYKPRMILFAEYSGGEILSSDFTGCYMMAFHFNPAKTEEEIKPLLNKPGDLKSRKIGGTFVAHVANDARDVFFDAVERDLIKVEAIIRPHNQETKGLVRRARENTTNPNWTGPQAGISGLTGGMIRLWPGVWQATVYNQERVPKGTNTPFLDTKARINPYTWDIRSVKDYSCVDVITHTVAIKAYIYARICLDCLTERRSDATRLESALRRLVNIKRTGWREVINVAVDKVLKIENDGSRNGYIGADIRELLMAPAGSEMEVINDLRARLAAPEERHD